MKISKKIWSLLLVFVLVTSVAYYPVKSTATETVEIGNNMESGYSGIKAREFTEEEYQKLVGNDDNEIAFQVYGSKDYSNYGNAYCRNNLNEYERTFYDGLYREANYYLTTTATAQKISDYYTTGLVSFDGISVSRALELTYVFMFQNPQFYFLDVNVIYRSSSSELVVCVYDIFGDGYSRADSTSQIFNKVDHWISQINAFSDSYSKLLKAQQIVCQNTVYQFGKYDQSAYSAIMLGESVCSGYTKFYSLLVNGADFECIGVTSSDHAWNIVGIDGSWYNVDTTWDDNGNRIPFTYHFLTSDAQIINDHIRESIYYEVAPSCNNNNENFGKHTLDSTGVYVAIKDKNHIFAGMTTLISINCDLEYRWIACNTLDMVWFEVQGWTKNNEWVDWYPDKSGNYVLKCQTRVCGEEEVYTEKSVSIEHHKHIKGKCQMPYTGKGGGYLIGFETYDNPNGQYRYEMLILDCTLLAQGKPAWIYTTGQCFVPETSFWTIWQPRYGYYWTLFRVYDAEGNLIDEACYGFQNI